MPGEGQVSALTAGDTLLAHFWDLASLEEDVREKAATALVEALVANQAEFEAESGAEASDEEEANGISGGGGKARELARALRRCSPLMIYAFKRLCRGLGSSRQGARQGFSLAIASLLGAVQCLGPAEAVVAIEGVLEPVGKGSELRDALLGRIFGYAAVIRSGQPLPAALASSLATGLVGAAAKKSFLREVAGAVLLELCTAVDSATLAGLVEGASAPLAPWLTASAADSSPDALLLALRLWPRLPAAAAAACPLLPGGFKAKQLPAAMFSDPAAAAGSKAVAAAAAAFFTKQHLTALLPVLRATTASHPRLHSVWPTLLALLIPGFSADKEQRDTGSKAPARPAAAALEAFWSTVVDGDLVASSHERKYLAFTLFQLLLPHLGPDQVSLVFTPAFLRCLALNLKKGDSYLHAGAKKCAERIGGFCERTPEVRIAVALALQRHGGAELERFATGGAGKEKKGDKADKSKGAAEGGKDAAGKEAGTDGAVAAEGLQQYVRQLQDAFLSGGSGEDASGEDAEAGAGAGQQQRQWAVEQLCSVLKQRAAPAAAKLEVLRFLAVHALFSVNAAAAKKSKDADVKAAAARSVDVPLPLRQLCAARLITLADSLDKQQQQHPQQQQGGKGGKGGKGSAPDQQQQQQQQAPRQEFLGSVAALVGKLQQSGAATLATATEGDEATLETAQAVADTLQRTLARMQARLAAGGGTPAEQQRLRALTHLLRLLLLHTLADPASADAALAADLDTVEAVAVEGRVAPQQAGKAASGGSGSDEEEGGEAEQPPHWHDTLMDVLLALLARNAAPLPSAPLRDAVEHAFRAFADELTATGMGDMLRVLARPLDSSAQEDGDVYASSDEEEEEEEMEVDGEAEEEAEEESEEEEEEQEQGSDEEEEPKPAKGAAAAAAAAKQAGSGSEEEGSSSEDEEAMSDEAMFRMDAKLASYFATLKEGKGGAARAARDELVNFKMRVAGLVEAFCKRVPASPLLPGAIPPLLAGLAGASRPGGHQALAERLSGLITNKLCGCKAEAAGAGLEAAALEQQLRRCLYLASRSTDKRVASAAWAAYVFLQRAAAGGAAPADCRAKGEESAKAAASDFFSKKKSRLQRGQLEGLARRAPALLPALLPAVLKAAAAARNEHLRVEAFHLLAAALKSAGSGAPKSLSSCGPALAAASLAAVKGPFSKPQRHVEALKLACQALESSGGAKLPAGKGGWQDVKAAAAAAQDSAADNPKLCAALTRLEGLLAEAPAAEQQQQQGGKRGKGGAAAAPKGGPAKKKQKS